jgi:energy-coupling factor transporter ATP-binding protein EcfA2
VYILDDPLSAVDVHVGKHIFDHFICGAVADRTRLLVTNQLQFTPQADRVVVMDAGRIVAQVGPCCGLVVKRAAGGRCKCRTWCQGIWQGEFGRGSPAAVLSSQHSSRLPACVCACG